MELLFSFYRKKPQTSFYYKFSHILYKYNERMFHMNVSIKFGFLI
jgi:hypothetical protein